MDWRSQRRSRSYARSSKELPDCDPRVQEGSKEDLLRVQEVAQAFEHSSLAGAPFAGQDHETLMALHTIDQIRQRRLMEASCEKETRGRGLD